MFRGPEDIFDHAGGARLTALTLLRTKLQVAIQLPEDKTKFCTCFYLSQQVLELTDNDLAKVIRVSRPTIGRWCRHETAPHPIGRGPILKYLLELVEKKLEFYESH